MKTNKGNYDPFTSPHVDAALYFLDQAQYLFQYKERSGVHNEPARTVSKILSAPDVSLAFTRKGFDSGWLGNGVIRAGRNQQGPFYVSFREPRFEKIVFQDKTEYTIPTPALLMVCARKAFFMAALNVLSQDEFTPKLPVFAAPFPNVDGRGGKICWGGNTSPSIDPMKAGGVMWLFFNSPFNKDLIDGKSIEFPKDVTEKYKDGPYMSYPLVDLVDLKTTAAQWVDSIIGRDME